MTLSFRDIVKPSDVEAIRAIVASTGFFHDFEIDVAVELVEDRVQKGDASDYHFVIAEQNGAVVGYTCYGLIACTVGSFDLYWIAVDNRARGGGIGRALIEQTESRIAKLDGRRIYIETSGRELYRPTQGFYRRCGYEIEAVLKDFYAPGDDKVIFSRGIA